MTPEEEKEYGEFVKSMTPTALELYAICMESDTAQKIRDKLFFVCMTTEEDTLRKVYDELLGRRNPKV